MVVALFLLSCPHNFVPQIDRQICETHPKRRPEASPDNLVSPCFSCFPQLCCWRSIRWEQVRVAPLVDKGLLKNFTLVQNCCSMAFRELCSTGFKCFFYDSPFLLTLKHMFSCSVPLFLPLKSLPRYLPTYPQNAPPPSKHMFSITLFLAFNNCS